MTEMSISREDKPEPLEPGKNMLSFLLVAGNIAGILHIPS